MDFATESFDKEKYMDAIIAYYDQTWFDYRLLWLDNNNRAVHFGFYDKSTMSHQDALVNMNRVLAERAGIKSDDRVLDAGCGQGGSAAWVAENTGATVVGITPVESQIKTARAFIESKGLGEKVKIKSGDYIDTVFPDESFDVIWACESVCHAKQKHDFYREAFRLLKPGGRLVMAEYMRTPSSYQPDGDKLLGQWLRGWAINDIDSAELHSQYAVETGFSDVQIGDVTDNIKPSLRRLSWISKMFLPAGIFCTLVGLRTKVQHGNIVGSIRQFEALDKNYWFYGILHATK